MLDTDTKRRIDTARDILVGKVPNPQSQVEQITIALIYKFMDDMDAESEELGGHRKFFAGEYARYGWAKLMRSGLGGHEMLALYGEAIAKMPENPGIPPLFRDIFKNAFLPYRNPETLRAFLKIIDEFEYDHSERLGDAFEYLLSVLGSQGDAGQFRTPRHIIDFIVEVVDPRKTDVILDPACGTAGFLISAYKHILRENCGFAIDDCGSKENFRFSIDDCGSEDGEIINQKSAITNQTPAIPNPQSKITNHKSQIQNLLTPDERGRLAANFKGYDISPDMVRLSLVNLYLHGFTDPHINEYDTLTSQDRWNEYADVILANPPFMSPKGGIKPHNRFSVQSKRSEVLFVDYMAEHLTPNGRAGIIVPEGIIFQSQTAYTQLRKLLVEEYLVAVVSLPAGVFNPYSGVKTSILILDKTLARQSQTIGFFKVENDGFGLGAQRREIAKNDLPQAHAEIAEYLRRLRAREPMADFQPALGLVVTKERIAANGDFNLSGKRYREGVERVSSYAHVRLDEIARVTSGNSAPQGEEYFAGGEHVFIRTSDVGAVHLSDHFVGSADKVNAKAVSELRLELFPSGTILFPKSGASTFLNHRVVIGAPAYVSSHLACIICDELKAIPKFVYHLLCRVDARDITPDQAYPSLRLSEIGAIQIPLPPLSIQKEIVAEIEGYQKVIDGARAVLDNYRPHIPIRPEWPMVELSDIAEVIMGQSPPGDTYNNTGEGVPLINGPVEFGPEPFSRTVINQYTTSPTRMCRKDDLIICVRGATLGRMNISGYDGCIGRGVAAIRSATSQRWIEFLIFAMRDRIFSLGVGSTFPSITQEQLRSLPIPLPPLETQRAIVAEIEAEQALVAANRDLIARMEKKIQATLARVWGEDDTTA